MLEENNSRTHVIVPSFNTFKRCVIKAQGNIRSPELLTFSHIAIQLSSLEGPS
jgi:D-ribose pyranose/furanose isomerase RbsD